MGLSVGAIEMEAGGDPTTSKCWFSSSGMVSIAGWAFTCWSPAGSCASVVDGGAGDGML